MTSMPAVRVVVRTLLLAGAAVVAYLALSLFDRPAHADDGGLDLGDPPVVTLPDEAAAAPAVAEDAGGGRGLPLVGGILGAVGAVDDTADQGSRDGDGSTGRAGDPPAGVHTGPAADLGPVPGRIKPDNARQLGSGDRKAEGAHRPGATGLAEPLAGAAGTSAGRAVTGLDELLGGTPAAGAGGILEGVATHTVAGATELVGAVVEPVLRMVYATTGAVLEPVVGQVPLPAVPGPITPADQEATPVQQATPVHQTTPDRHRAPSTTAVPAREAASAVTAGVAAGPPFGASSSITKPPRPTAAAGRVAAARAAAPAPGPSGLGGCVPGGCAHTTDAIGAGGQPLVLPSPCAVRPDAPGRLVAPPAGLVHTGRLPGVAPLPG